MEPGEISLLLAEGSRGSVAQSGKVPQAVVEDPALLETLIDCLQSDNATIVSHAAHALLTVSNMRLNLLAPHTDTLLAVLERDQWEILEQLAKILPQLELSGAQRDRLTERLKTVFYQGRSSIARTCALQALVDMAHEDAAIRADAGEALAFALENGSKAMQARARRLLPKASWLKTESP